MPQWNPGQYLKFGEERTRPAHDLCARIQLSAPGRLLDLGCGPGNSTRVLRDRWPAAGITGLDSSPEMIAQARASWPGGTWLLADAAALGPGAPYDVVFSNAALQWLPDHEALLPRLLGQVAAGGCLAVQVPALDGTLLRSSLRSVARRPRWYSALAGAEDALSFHPADFYYDLLAPLASRLELWETTYYHVMASHRALIDWFEATGMRPFLERLGGEDDREAFKAEVLEACRPDYPPARDGKVLMPFKRLFFIAWKD
jgi:trans-aconitate 2-methyltransferase